MFLFYRLVCTQQHDTLRFFFLLFVGIIFNREKKKELIRVRSTDRISQIKIIKKNTSFECDCRLKNE